MLLMACLSLWVADGMGQGQRRPRFQREAFTTDTPMVHDPVMAFEDSTYYIYATGMGRSRNVAGPYLDREGRDMLKADGWPRTQRRPHADVHKL